MLEQSGQFAIRAPNDYGNKKQGVIKQEVRHLVER